MTTRRVAVLGVAIGLLFGAMVVLVAVVEASRAPDTAGEIPNRSAPSARQEVPLSRSATGAQDPPAATPSTLRGRPARALQIFAAWSRRRGAAWAIGDSAALRGLYASEPAARAELALWSGYRERGLRVEGMTSQVVAIRVVHWSPRRLVVTVDERSAGGVVVGPGKHAVALPRDRVDRRRVVLVRRDGELWQVARIDAAPRPVRSGGGQPR